MNNNKRQIAETDIVRTAVMAWSNKIAESKDTTYENLEREDYLEISQCGSLLRLSLAVIPFIAFSKNESTLRGMARRGENASDFVLFLMKLMRDSLSVS